MKVFVIRVETDEEYSDVETALENAGFYCNDLLEVYEDEDDLTSETNYVILEDEQII